jgi:heavy metal sensor kinase
MRSIRLSLVLYFLGLLLVALGVASYWTYHLAQTTLIEKREKTEELIQAQYRDRCREAEERLRKDLLFQAQTLARLAYFYSDSTRATNYRVLGELGVLTAVTGPNPWTTLPTWGMQATRWGPISQMVWRKSMGEIRFNEFDLFQHVDGQVAEYFQIDSSWGTSYRSASLGQLAFPANIKQLTSDEPVSWEFDHTSLGTDHAVHRVVLKVPATRLLPWGTLGAGDFLPPGPVRSNPRNPQPPPKPPETGPPGPRPTLVIQCACDSDHLDETLLGFKETRNEELTGLRRRTEQALTDLRGNLIAMAAVSFAAMILGTLGIVRWGLMPLRRLSTALGQVSTRDFKLPLDARQMPIELRPIIAHLEETLEMLKRAFAREKQATADISHELRTPLAALLTTTELALRKNRTAEEYRELILDCRASAQTMTQIVERLLILARLDAGVDRIRPQSVDVAQLADQCAAVVRPLAEAAGLQLRVQHAPMVPASTDPDKLREVLNNLLHNAIQYNRPNGAIDVNVSESGGLIHVEVTDTGIGISPEVVPLIFERFYRADPSRGGDGLHAGLGLAIVKEYVELLGGTIVVKSEPGRGSTFRVDLPPILSRT